MGEFNREDYKSCINDLKLALTFDPDNSDISDLLDKARNSLEESIKSAIDKTKEAIQNKDLMTAEKYCKRILELDSGNEEASVLLTQIARERVNVELERDVSGSIAEAKLLIEDGKVISYSKALKLLEDAFRLKHDDEELRSMLADVRKRRNTLMDKLGRIDNYRRVGKYEEALTEIEELIGEGITETADGGKLFEALTEVEAAARTFSSQRAMKYMNDVEAALEKGDPHEAERILLDAFNLFMLPDEVQQRLESELEHVIKLENVREEANTLLDEAAKLTNEGSYDEAKAILGKVKLLELNIPEADEYLERVEGGIAAQTRGELELDYIKAETAFKEDNFEEAKRLALEILEKIGDNKRLESFRDKIRSLLDDIVQTMKLRENILRTIEVVESYIEEERYDLAEKELERLNELSSEDSIELDRIRLKFIESKIIAENCADASKALERADCKASIELCEKCLAKNPNYDKARLLRDKAQANLIYNEGVSAYDQDDLDRARDCFEQVISLGGDKKEQAERYLNRIQKRKEDDEYVRNMLKVAEDYRKKGRLREAFQGLNKISDIRSSHIREVVALLTDIRDELREELALEVKNNLEKGDIVDIRRAQELLSQLREELPDIASDDISLERRIGIAYRKAVGDNYINAGKWSEARRELEEARQIEPTDPEIQLKLNEVHKREVIERSRQERDARNLEGSIELLKNLEAQRRDDMEVKLILAQYYLEAKRYDEARNYCEYIIQYDPEGRYDFEVSRLMEEIIREHNIAERLSQADDMFQRGRYLQAVRTMRELCYRYPTRLDLESRSRKLANEAIQKLIDEAEEKKAQGGNEGEEVSSLALCIELLPIYLDIIAIDPENYEIWRVVDELIMNTKFELNQL